MKKVGIWLDKEKALCFALEGQKEHFETIASELEFFNARGGSRSKTRWGPQEVVKDSKYLEREKHQLKRYFENIVSNLENTAALVIYGPAQTPEKFAKMLQTNYPILGSKIEKVEKVDSMTENQFKALIKAFFSS